MRWSFKPILFPLTGMTSSMSCDSSCSSLRFLLCTLQQEWQAQCLSGMFCEQRGGSAEAGGWWGYTQHRWWVKCSHGHSDTVIMEYWFYMIWAIDWCAEANSCLKYFDVSQFQYMLTPKHVLLTSYHFLCCRDGYTPVMVALWFQRLEALRFFIKVVFNPKLFSPLFLLFHYLIEWHSLILCHV